MSELAPQPDDLPSSRPQLEVLEGGKKDDKKKEKAPGITLTPEELEAERASIRKLIVERYHAAVPEGTDEAEHQKEPIVRAYHRMDEARFVEIFARAYFASTEPTKPSKQYPDAFDPATEEEQRFTGAMAYALNATEPAEHQPLGREIAADQARQVRELLIAHSEDGVGPSLQSPNKNERDLALRQANIMEEAYERRHEEAFIAALARAYYGSKIVDDEERFTDALEAALRRTDAAEPAPTK